MRSTPSARRVRSCSIATRWPTARSSTSTTCRCLPSRERGSLEPELETLRAYIDWTFFFAAWELKGRFPKLLDDPEKGEAARELYANANELLDEIVAGGLLRAQGVYGFWPARADGEDVVLGEGVRLPMLRQQTVHPDGRPNLLARRLRRTGR